MRWTPNTKGHTPFHVVHGVQISAQGIQRDPYFPALRIRMVQEAIVVTRLLPSSDTLIFGGSAYSALHPPQLRHQKNYVLHGQFLHALPMTTTARFNLLFTLYPLFLLFHKVRHPRTESATRNHVYPEHPF